MRLWNKASNACCLLVILLFITTDCHATTISQTALLAQRQRWTDTAFNHIKSLNCTQTFFLNSAQCTYFSQLQKKDVAVYIAQQGLGDREAVFVSMLPDGNLDRSLHSGVLVIDPFPKANHGHIVIAFFIDYISNITECRNAKGKYTAQGECLTMAVKRRCRNAIERNLHNDNVMTPKTLRRLSRRCSINFIPYIYSTNDPEPVIVNGISSGYEQRLLCREDMEEYALCPEMRPANETLHLLCNPIRDNTRRCETSHEVVSSRCRMFERCDQAIMISGGWNPQHSLVRHEDNIKNMYHLLRRNGFQQVSMKVFFANGMSEGLKEENGETSDETEVFPAAMKTAMRFHIRHLCGRPYCVDSLVLYLNSPTMSDGTILLWDVNRNGRADDDEKYTLKEFLLDISDCYARNVQIIADQSFSGLLTKALRKSSTHDNVMAYSSGKELEYSFESHFTDYWVGVDHSHSCSQDVFQAAKTRILTSNPDASLIRTDKSGSRPTSGAVTLFGAPCNFDPPFSEYELNRHHRGCQNLPTEVWVNAWSLAFGRDQTSLASRGTLASETSQNQDQGTREVQKKRRRH